MPSGGPSNTVHPVEVGVGVGVDVGSLVAVAVGGGGTSAGATAGSGGRGDGVAAASGPGVGAFALHPTRIATRLNRTSKTTARVFIVRSHLPTFRRRLEELTTAIDRLPIVCAPAPRKSLPGRTITHPSFLSAGQRRVASKYTSSDRNAPRPKRNQPKNNVSNPLYSIVP